MKGGKRKMSVNFDKHSVEKRHNQRFLGVFLMFVVVAVVVGVFSALSISAVTGYGVFDFLKPSTSVTSVSSGPGPNYNYQLNFNGSNGTNGTQPGNWTQPGQEVTYQGVLDMFNKCSVLYYLRNNVSNMTCNQVCKTSNAGTCTAAYQYENDLGVKRVTPIGCDQKSGYEFLVCNCCKVPGEEYILYEMEGLCMESGSKCENSMN